MGRGGELPPGAHGERARVQAVQVGHDQQQVGGGLDGQEAAAGDVDAQGVVEGLDGRAHRRLQLDDILASIQRLRIQKRRRFNEKYLEDPSGGHEEFFPWNSQGAWKVHV